MECSDSADYAAAADIILRVKMKITIDFTKTYNYYAEETIVYLSKNLISLNWSSKLWHIKNVWHVVASLTY